MKLISAKQASPLSLVLAVGFIIPFYASSQVGTRNPIQVIDGTSAPRAHVRNDDVLLARTVWQRIDVREKMNRHLAFPQANSQHRKALFDYITEALLGEQQFLAYSAGVFGDNDMFDTPLSKSEVADILFSTDTIYTPSPYADSMMRVILEHQIQAKDIIAYEIKEQWFIDKQRSVMDVRIIGICPVQAVFDENTGSFRGFKRLFWIYYPDARHAFASWPVYDHHNDTQFISYDALFTARKFHAHIIKVSNVHNRSLAEYLKPIDALLTGQSERENLRNLELDLWNY